MEDPFGQLIASLAFGDRRPADQEWVLRRYREMYDRLQETPLSKEMTRLASEKARQEGLQEGQLMALRGTLLSLVEKRFPQLSRSAKQLVSTVERASVLENLILDISTASTPKEARRYLRDIGKENTHD